MTQETATNKVMLKIVTYFDQILSIMPLSRWCPPTFSTAAVVRRPFSQISPIYTLDFSRIVPNSGYRWIKPWLPRNVKLISFFCNQLLLGWTLLSAASFFSGNINDVGMKWTFKWTRRQNNFQNIIPTRIQYFLLKFTVYRTCLALTC